MRLRKAADFVESRLSPVSSVLGNIGAGIIAVLMILTVSDVVGRRVFNHPLSGAFELTQLMMVIVVFFTIVHCEFARGHIALDIMVSRLRPRTQNIIASFTYVFFLVAFCFLTWNLIQYAMRVWLKSLTSGILQVPIFPFVFVAALGCALLSLLVLIHLLQFIAEALRE